MRVCLASAPTIAEFTDLDRLAAEASQRIPLGILSLASTLRRGGNEPAVVDLDTVYARWRGDGGGRGDFVRHAARELARVDADVYGLSTICSSYPLTIRIAAALREERPGCRLVLGGPQASAAADETLAAFPCVDVVVRGEGEPVLPALLDALAASRDLSSVPGISYRSRGGVVRTRDAALVEDLDALPLPAYDLYPALRRGAPLPLEVGRGCPFSCTFCSTSRFFGRTFRMRSAARIVADMRFLRRRFGTRRFELVHDNFTVDRRRVVAFCEAVLATRSGITWSCSSRTDTLDDELLDLMRRAGCRGIFFGVESGSQAMQDAMRKRLDLAGARLRLVRASRRGIRSTVSFIAGFPEETREDLGATVSLFVEVLRLDLQAPQIGLLSPLTGTAVHEQHRDALVRGEVVSSVAFQGEEQARADAALIARHPGMFSSFYSVPTRGLDPLELHELCQFLNNAKHDLRWLLVAAAQVEGGGLEAFAAFRARRRLEGARSAAELAAYYRGRAFRRDFVRFVREVLARRHRAAAPALRALARYYGSLLRRPRAARRSPRPLLRPFRARNVLLTPIGCDGAALVRCLREGGDLALVPRRPSTLVTREARTHDELVQVDREAADLLRLCDGTRDVRAVARHFRRAHPHVHGVRGDAAALYALELFRRRRLVVT
ncbi:MAG TPA: radical SAM protein [Anaeromyxobacter sp.]|nr:radical SAM protein [Anaeromyxobacter sp.]